MRFTYQLSFNTSKVIKKIFLALLCSGAVAYGSTVDCTNGPSDPNAIQAAINAGGTVTINNTCALGGAIIQVNNSVTVTGNATFNSGAAYAFSVNSDDVSFSGLTFEGAGLILRKLPTQNAFVFQ